MDPASAATVDGDKEIGRCRFEACQGGKKSSFPCRSGDRKIEMMISCVVSSSTTCAIVRSYIRFGKGSGSEGRELGEVGGRSFVGSIHGRVCAGYGS